MISLIHENIQIAMTENGTVKRVFKDGEPWGEALDLCSHPFVRALLDHARSMEDLSVHREKMYLRLQARHVQLRQKERAVRGEIS